MAADAHREGPGTKPTELTLKLIDIAAVALRYVAPWVFLCVALYLFLQIVRAAVRPGSDALVDILTNVTRTRALAFVFGLMGTIYGIRERNLRRSTVSRLKTRIDALEREVVTMRRASES